MEINNDNLNCNNALSDKQRRIIEKIGVAQEDLERFFKSKSVFVLEAEAGWNDVEEKFNIRFDFLDYGYDGNLFLNIPNEKKAVVVRGCNKGAYTYNVATAFFSRYLSNLFGEKIKEFQDKAFFEIRICKPVNNIFDGSKTPEELIKAGEVEYVLCNLYYSESLNIEYGISLEKLKRILLERFSETNYSLNIRVIELNQEVFSNMYSLYMFNEDYTIWNMTDVINDVELQF